MSLELDTTLTFRLDSATKKTFELVAKLNDEPVAEVLRRAIHSYLSTHAEDTLQMEKVTKRKTEGK